MRVKIVGVLAALTLGAAIAAPVLSQTPPAPPAASVADVVRGVRLPYEQFTLPNGLRVVVHTDRKAPIVSVAAWYNVGSKDEQPGRTGFAHLFEHIMLFNGTENVANPTAVLRDVGATDWNGTTWFDRTNYFETVPTPALERALYLESERMGHLLAALTQERLDNQRGVVQNEKRQGDNQPFGLVQYATLETLFPEGHPYRHTTIGSMADLDNASLEDVRNWFRNNYGPNNAVLVLAGDVDVPTARRLVERYFGDIARGPTHTPVQAAVPTLPARVDRVMQDRVANVRLYRQWAVPGRTDPDAVPLDAAASIIAGLASSRLDNALVRGDQSAVAVGAEYQYHHRVGIFTITVDVKPGQDAEAVGRRLDAILDDFARNGPTAEEVQRAAMTYASQQAAALEQVGGFGGKTVSLAEGALYHDDPGHDLHVLQAWAALTPAQVRAVTQRWLTRPVFALRVEPGARPAYQEAASTRATPAPAAPLPRGPARPLPAVAAIPPLDFPAVERARLSNGVEVTYARRTGAPITQVALEFDAGVASDPADHLGLQRLTLDLLTEGTTTRTSAQLAAERERLGATLAAASGLDRSALLMQTVSANLRPSLALLADVARNPAFAPAEVERIRARQLATIAQERANPNGIANRAVPVVLYGEGHPYGRPWSGLGSPESVQGLSRDDLVRFHQTWFRPDAARLFVVSDRPLAEITPLLEQTLGTWRAPATPRGRKAFPDAIPATPSRIVLIDRPQSPQSVIAGGWVTPISGAGDDPLVFNAANEIVGNNFLSRINQDIRETRGWSYGVRSYLQLAEHRSPYLIAAPVQADRTGESVAALLENYRAFNGPRGVTPEELMRTVNGSTRQLAGQFELSTAVLAALRSNALYGRPDDYWERAGPRYQALTAAQLNAAARANIDPDRFVWVIVGDAATVRPQLERLGLPVEVRPAS